MVNQYKDVPHLIFRVHDSQRNVLIEIDSKDKKILRELGKQYAEIASLPIQNEKRKMWKSLNDLKAVKPMIWVNEVCWNEMEVDDELRIRTSSELCQMIESELRRVIYKWRHMPGDMVVEPVICSPLIINNTGIGITEKVDIVFTEEDNDVVSRHYFIQIKNEEDIDKIKKPKITHNKKRSLDFFQAYSDIFDGIVKVEMRGVPGFWFAPWDDIIAWTGIQEGLMDLSLRPDYIHKLVKRLVSVYIDSLEQYEKLNLLALNNCNVRIGSGAYGYTNELPKKDFNTKHIRAKDIWGASAAQIFAVVSEQMHKEFGIDYEKLWLEKFGLSYYGCCEPLDKKVDILRDISTLRKISISPWADLEQAIYNIGNGYVISLKPSPAIFANEIWDPGLVRDDLDKKLKIAKGHNVEVIMKDISTVKHSPERLWEWVSIASELVEKYSL